jgi:hypothetical protein
MDDGTVGADPQGQLLDAVARQAGLRQNLNAAGVPYLILARDSVS